MARRIDRLSIDFFRKGVVKVKSISEFLDSYAGRYLTAVYGELEYSDTTGTNFINVYHNGESFILFDSIFSDKCHTSTARGFIIPKSIKKRTRRIIQSKYQCLRNLASFGYTQIDHDIDIGKYVQDMMYVRLEDNHTYDVPHDYLKHIQNDPNSNTTIKGLEPLRDKIFTLIKARFKDNHLITQNCVAETRVQRMISGDSIIRHFGADKGEPYIMTALAYHAPFSFVGRELYGGERHLNDLSEYITRFCIEEEFNSYTDSPEEYEDTFEMKPTANSLAIVSATNPIYYHAVKEHLGGGEVYAVITDIRLK